MAKIYLVLNLHYKIGQIWIKYNIIIIFLQRFARLDCGAICRRLSSSIPQMAPPSGILTNPTNNKPVVGLRRFKWSYWEDNTTWWACHTNANSDRSIIMTTERQINCSSRELWRQPTATRKHSRPLATTWCLFAFVSRSLCPSAWWLNFVWRQNMGPSHINYLVNTSAGKTASRAKKPEVCFGTKFVTNSPIEFDSFPIWGISTATADDDEESL